MILLMPVDPVCGIELEEEMAVSLFTTVNHTSSVVKDVKGSSLENPRSMRGIDQYKY